MRAGGGGPRRDPVPRQSVTPTPAGWQGKLRVESASAALSKQNCSRNCLERLNFLGVPNVPRKISWAVGSCARVPVPFGVECIRASEC
jgi:hypothetical protein